MYVLYVESGTGAIAAAIKFVTVMLLCIFI